MLHREPNHIGTVGCLMWLWWNWSVIQTLLSYIWFQNYGFHMCTFFSSANIIPFFKALAISILRSLLDFHFLQCSEEIKSLIRVLPLLEHLFGNKWTYEAEMQNLWSSRWCWMTASSIPRHWPCWLWLPEVVVQQLLEGYRFLIPAIRQSSSCSS